MLKAIETYAAIIVTVIFVFIVPLFITKACNDLYKSNDKDHQIEEMVWMIEQERCVHTELIKYPLKVECFSEQGNIVAYVPAKENKLSDNTKYVYISYGGKERWIIIE